MGSVGMTITIEGFFLNQNDANECIGNSSTSIQGMAVALDKKRLLAYVASHVVPDDLLTSLIEEIVLKVFRDGVAPQVALEAATYPVVELLMSMGGTAMGKRTISFKREELRG